MAIKSAINLKKEFSEMPAEFYEPLTFGELKEGDKFISLPAPGDNDGHGGFKGAHYIFIKIKRIPGSHDSYKSAVRLKGGTFSMIPDGMLVIKVE